MAKPTTKVEAIAAEEPLFHPYFARSGSHPFDLVPWEKRTASITDAQGNVIFKQENVEIPKFWSQTATNIAVSKYFRGRLGTPQRETSARQMVGRVSQTIAGWGKKDGYFQSEQEAEQFEAELAYLLIHQHAAFNSPVWFNFGVEPRPQGSACQPYHALVNTAQGLMPIGEIVEKNRIGLPVFDSEGLTQVTAVKQNGKKEVFRIQLNDGFFVEATGDHVVGTHDERRTHSLEWKRVDQLKAGMHMRLYPRAAAVTPPSSAREVSEAALAGWLQADGSVGQYETGTNRSLTMEFLTVNDEEFAWVQGHLEVVFPNVHRKVREFQTKNAHLHGRRIRLYGEELRPFVERYGLLARGLEMRAPQTLWTAGKEAVAAYLKSLFQSEGYAAVHGESAHIALAMSSRKLVEDAQVLLTRLGIYSRVRQKLEARPDRWNVFELNISVLSEREKFLNAVGFVDSRKNGVLMQSVALQGKDCPDIRFPQIVSITSLGEMEVYDIQTQSGCYLSNSVLVHNCFINSLKDDMRSILQLVATEGMLFKYGSGTGTNFSVLRSSKEHLSFSSGKASGPVSFMKGFDTFAGVIRSGGKTRRAAKMVILNADHPDIAEFINCKANEEKKAWALIEAGYNPAVDGEAYGSVFFQNANHSVRVTDEFMQAVLEDKEWKTKAVTTGETVDTFKARDLMRMIAEATYVCGDPGMQFDTTINRWHTSKNTDRIYASNPCSEFMYLNDTACNLASLNLMKFRKTDGAFDLESYKRAIEVMITAMEIIVGNSSYPTEAITKNSHDYRPLGLGYANLGALLMSNGLAYDSEEGRNYAAAVTALLSGHAYKTSALLAAKMGPFSGYKVNEEPMLQVIGMHRNAAYAMDAKGVPAELMQAARGSWDEALETGKKHGFKNAQISVLAPTGTIGFLMDCDTTGVEPDIALVKYKWLVGGGVIKIVNQTVPLALEKLGYTEKERKEILEYLESNDTIEGAPHLKEERLAVFDCAFKAKKGKRSILPMGHVKMMGAVQPFISGAISKTVNVPENVTTEEIMETYIEAWKLGLKAIAIYRDGSKRTQPLTTGKEETRKQEQIVYKPVRRRLPDERHGITHKFAINNYEGYATVGLYEDGTPGEIFITMSKEGSTISGLMDAFATSVSMALQYGVPLRVLATKFINSRFEPSGYTQNPEIKTASSVMDYLFRWLALKFCSDAELAEMGLQRPQGKTQENMALRQAHLSLEPNKPPATEDAKMQLDEPLNGKFSSDKTGFAGTQQIDAPPCRECGSIMVRSGSCYKCFNCGSTSGCS